MCILLGWFFLFFFTLKHMSGSPNATQFADGNMQESTVQCVAAEGQTIKSLYELNRHTKILVIY